MSNALLRCCALGALSLSYLFAPTSALGGDADATIRDSAFEQLVLVRLSRINEEAVVVFQQATTAFDADRLDEAREKYLRVLELAPGFADAHRRLSYLETRAGNKSRALVHADNACQADSSPYNRTAVAAAILDAEAYERYNDALDCAWKGVDSLPAKVHPLMVLLHAGVMTENDASIRRASESLVRLAPDYAAGHFFHGLSLAQDSKWLAAEREILLSKELGMSPAAVESVLAEGIASHALVSRWIRRGIVIVALWAAILVGLLAAGVVMSRMTTNAVNRTLVTGEFGTGKAERQVRHIYKSLIGVTSVYFYVSLPLLFVIVLAGGGGLLYAMFALGRIPIKLALLIAAGTLLTLYAIVRSALAKPKEEVPGRPLTREEAPGLWDVTDEVAAKVKTRPIDAIYITPGTEIAVTERGSWLTKLRGQGRRCLILGMGAMSGLAVGPLKSVLAHEYGHFSHGDTAGGNLAHHTNRSLLEMVITLASNGLNTWYNPAWWFIKGFNSAFALITLGASRLQEILADRLAGIAYGTKNFVTGLTHVIRQSLTFDLQLQQAYAIGREHFVSVQNLYDLPLPSQEPDDPSLDSRLADILCRPTSAYDSHPAPNDRFALLRKMNLPDPATEDMRSSLHLLQDPIALQREMTAVIQGTVTGG